MPDPVPCVPRLGAVAMLIVCAGCASPVSHTLSDLITNQSAVIQQANVDANLDPIVGTWHVDVSGYRWETTVVPGTRVGTREFQYVGFVTEAPPYFTPGESMLALNATVTPGVYAGYQKWRNAFGHTWYPATIRVRGDELLQTNDLPRTELVAIDTEWRCLRVDRLASVPSTFLYAGKEYPDEREALAAAEREFSRLVSKITPSQRKAGGVLQVSVPPESHFVQYVDDTIAPTAAGKAYVARVNRRSYEAIGDVIQRAGAFGEVRREASYVHRDEPLRGSDYLVWIEYPAGQWYLKTRADPTPRPLPIDVAEGDEGRRWNRWVADLVEACAPRQVTAATPAPPPKKAKDEDNDAAAKAKKKPFLSSGTGFVVREDGFVLTNYHVVRGSVAIVIGSTMTGRIAASVVATDHLNDLALLRVEHRFDRVLHLSPQPPLTPGDPIVVIGYPLSWTLASDGVLTTGSVSALAGIQNDTTRFQFAAPIQPGNSGGPVIGEDGIVVGVVVETLTAAQNANFAIRSSLARAFVEANGIDLPEPAAGMLTTAAETWKRAKPAIVRVEAWVEE